MTIKDRIIESLEQVYFPAGSDIESPDITTDENGVMTVTLENDYISEIAEYQYYNSNNGYYNASEPMQAIYNSYISGMNTVFKCVSANLTDTDKATLQEKCPIFTECMKNALEYEPADYNPWAILGGNYTDYYNLVLQKIDSAWREINNLQEDMPELVETVYIISDDELRDSEQLLMVKSDIYDMGSYFDIKIFIGLPFDALFTPVVEVRIDKDINPLEVHTIIKNAVMEKCPELA